MVVCVQYENSIWLNDNKRCRIFSQLLKEEWELLKFPDLLLIQEKIGPMTTNQFGFPRSRVQHVTDLIKIKIVTYLT